VKDSADALMVVINDILDFSKIESGKLELESLPFDVRRLASDCIHTLESRAIQKGLSITSHIIDDVPHSVIGDSARLRQVLLNLLGNAIKFTNQGAITLTISRCKHTTTNTELCFVVSDTGIGIAADKQKSIFEAFSQADGSTTRQYGGTGLGLTICSRLVSLMGGQIHVESELGQGSRFSFNAQFVLAS
jgi:signal transduction histidine kinase